MIELATLKTIVDLFKELIDIVNGQEKLKRESFERIVKPLYDQLQPVAKEYYIAVNTAVSKLNDPLPDYPRILRELEDSRAAIAFARNGILGQLEAFRGKREWSRRKNPSQERLVELSYNFASSVFGYFYDSEEAFIREESVLTGLLISLADLSEPPVDEKPKSNPSADYPGEEDFEVPYRHTPTGARSNAQQTVKALESGWIYISKSYAELKLYCNA